MNDQTPTLPHLSTEFFVWLWFTGEDRGGTIDLGGDIGVIDLWVDERLSFRAADEDRTRAVLTGENTSSAPEALAALASGKLVRDVQVHVRREAREYSVTLRGPHLDLSGLKFPTHATDGEEELLYERMFLYEDLVAVLGALYQQFAQARAGGDWHTQTLPAIRQWVAGADPA